MKTQMQELATFCEHQAKETLSTEVKRALMGIVSVINTTCIKPEKEIIKNAFNESRKTHPTIGFKHKSFDEYYNDIFKL